MKRFFAALVLAQFQPFSQHSDNRCLTSHSQGLSSLSICQVEAMPQLARRMGVESISTTVKTAGSPFLFLFQGGEDRMTSSCMMW
jgi:hypothetical protein